MSLRLMKTEIRILKKMSLLTGTFVAGLGVIIVSGILQPPQQGQSPSRAIQRLATLAGLGRAPAAIAPKILLGELKLPCELNGPQIYQNYGPQVRLVLQNCDRTTQSVSNLTNQFSATLIATEDGFTTDYIELRPGSNRLQITQANASGEKSEHIITVNSSK
jgi:hypothetical protein